LLDFTTRKPDFCWIATDSECINPVLIEIETPYKRWFVHDRKRRGEQHGDLVHARSQVDRWKAWFAKPDNRMWFLRGSIACFDGPSSTVSWFRTMCSFTAAGASSATIPI
jgi:hypothetical protein